MHMHTIMYIYISGADTADDAEDEEDVSNEAAAAAEDEADGGTTPDGAPPGGATAEKRSRRNVLNDLQYRFEEEREALLATLKGACHFIPHDPV